jgi:hypothetical protein
VYEFQANNLENLHKKVADYEKVVDDRDGAESVVSAGFRAQVCRRGVEVLFSMVDAQS